MKTLGTIAASFSILACASAFAAPANVQTTPLTGPYVGVYAGHDWSDVSAVGASPDLEGWDGGVFVGYRLDTLMDSMNGMGIGMNGAVEAFYGDSTSDGAAGGASFNKEDEWGVSLRPGFSALGDIAGVTPYGIVGYRNTKYEGNGLGLTGSERFHGFELGAGTELVSYGNIGVRAEYSHVWYNSENGIDPSSDDVRLGLAYHF